MILGIPRCEAGDVSVFMGFILPIPVMRKMIHLFFEYIIFENSRLTDFSWL